MLSVFVEPLELLHCRASPEVEEAYLGFHCRASGSLPFWGKAWDILSARRFSVVNVPSSRARYSRPVFFTQPIEAPTL
jgi:hypothetical protein